MVSEFYGVFSTEEVKGAWKNRHEKNAGQVVVDHERLFISSTSDKPFPNDNFEVFEDEAYITLFYGSVYDKQKWMEKYNTVAFTEAITTMFHSGEINSFRSIRGSFLFVIYSKNDEKLHLIRDPFGIRELFYTKIDGAIVFSPFKKCVTSFLEEENVNELALQHYLSYQYVPNPLSLSEDVHVVLPGHYLTVDRELNKEQQRYFEVTFQPVLTEKNEHIKAIRDVLFETVATYMENEASIGSFLSGGIDSTFIASIAKEYKHDLKTFSVGFAREGFSEIDVAKETADKLGVENISRVITPEEYVNQLKDIMWNLEDPLADPACVPLYFVANLAKEHVDIALSGEGADELFGGYNIYREPESLKSFNYIPGFMKSALRGIARALPDQVKGKSFLERGTTPLQDRYIGNAKIFEEAEKKGLLRTYDSNVAYTQITKPLYERVADEPLITQMQYIDLHTWLPGDILLKARKMTGMNELEVRMPFLDINVFDVASKIPTSLTIADQTTKKILREAARGIIPDHVLDRKKLGFPVPIRHWLKNELNSWAKQLIKESETDAYLNKNAVLALLDAHCNTSKDYSRKLWTILMFMLWHQLFIEQA